MSDNTTRDNLREAEKIREEYFNRKTEKRSFAVGDKVLVKFPKIPRGVNPKFFKKWRGGFIVMKKVGELNLVVRGFPHSKPILVHVDWVKAQTVNDRLVSFNPKIGADLPFSSPLSDDEDGPVLQYSAEPDFGAYIESALDSDEDKEEADKEKEAVGGAERAPAASHCSGRACSGRFACLSGSASSRYS